jgi:16S rRNA (uracil1498-N3)-methyltransferase
MLHLFKVDQLPDHELTLTGNAGKHAAASLRLRVGEQVTFTDGVGNSAIGTVTQLVSKTEVSFKLSEPKFVPQPMPKISVLQALPKGDGALEAVELMVEVGVDEIYPWQANRSVAQWDDAKKISGVKKWQITADAAAAQARRVWFPTIKPIVTDLNQLAAKFDQIIVMHELATAPIPKSISQNVLIVIGPEGSITDVERAQLQEIGGIEARMGESILRSRHAGIAAAAAVLAQSARWGNG